MLQWTDAQEFAHARPLWKQLCVFPCPDAASTASQQAVNAANAALAGKKPLPLWHDTDQGRHGRVPAWL